ncbi:MAG: polymerase delta subunit [Candidatus Aminicenantes bacterium]|nr:polymerase delta subunit [Candidatus Aminicenantes bacterium]
MAFPDPLSGGIREDHLPPGYVFYGEEDYLADEFVHKLRKALISPDAQAFGLERFELGQVRWPEIIDTARTAPFFFSPWRIVVVRTVEEKKSAKEAGEGKGDSKKLSSLDEKILREYFRSPASRTVLVVVISGIVKKTHPLVRFFDSLKPRTVVLVEMKRLKRQDLLGWMTERLASLGKSATQEALARLEEVAGSDLRRIDQEIEKLANYAADRRRIEIEDVLQVCEWTRSFIEWELTEALKGVDQKRLLLTLGRAFKEGERPENVIRVLANFFRDLLLAKLWLKEGRDRKEIFGFFKPQLQETWSLYATEFKALFSLLERLSLGEILWAVRELEKIDLSLKSQDVAIGPLLERFVVEFCRRLKKSPERKGPIWKATG